MKIHRALGELGLGQNVVEADGVIRSLRKLVRRGSQNLLARCIGALVANVVHFLPIVIFRVGAAGRGFHAVGRRLQAEASAGPVRSAASAIRPQRVWSVWELYTSSLHGTEPT